MTHLIKLSQIIISSMFKSSLLIKLKRIFLSSDKKSFKEKIGKGFLQKDALVIFHNWVN